MCVALLTQIHYFHYMRITTAIFCWSILFAACADAPNSNKETTESVNAVAEDEYEVEEWSETVMDFTPDGYVLLKTFTGDLNRDAYEDMVAVFDAIDSNDEMRNRAVMLLTTDADGKLAKAAINKNGAHCKDCGGVLGDPFVQVVIKDGYFTIEHFGGSRQKWNDDPTFKYSEEDGKWYLHKHNKSVHDGLDPEHGSTVTILTTKDFGKVSFEDFSY